MFSCDWIDDVGKRVRRRRTGDLPVSASSAETDMSSSVDNNMMMGRRASPQPAADLRANLRKTSQPPAFIRPPPVSTQDNNENVPSPAVALEHSKSPSPYSSVPWRTGKVAVKTTEPAIKTEDLTARIEALTAMAHQTVAKVDRLTATPDREVQNGSHHPAGGVKAVATKLLNRVQPASPQLPTSVGRRPVAAKIEPPVASATSNSSPAVKLSPAAPVLSAQQREQQQPSAPFSKNRAAVNQIDKTLAATRANNVAPAAALGRNKTADPDATTTQNRTVDNGTSSAPSTVKAVQGILKKKVEGVGAESPGLVRIRPEASAPELYPILRVEEDVVVSPSSDPVSILKKRFEEPPESSSALTVPADGSPEPHSILKRPLSRDGSAESGRSQSPVDPISSILKRASLTPSPAISDQVSSPSATAAADPRPILKKRSSTDDPGIARPILKKKSSTDDEHEPAAHKPILKSVGGSRTSSEQLDLDGHLSRLRRTENRETSPARTAPRAEPDTRDEPEEERPEGEEPPRQLSVAERINCMELQTNSPIVAPWRLPSRPNPPAQVPANGSETPPSLPALWRR